jgi:hypothetical protein
VAATPHLSVSHSPTLHCTRCNTYVCYVSRPIVRPMPRALPRNTRTLQSRRILLRTTYPTPILLHTSLPYPIPTSFPALSSSLLPLIPLRTLHPFVLCNPDPATKLSIPCPHFTLRSHKILSLKAESEAFPTNKAQSICAILGGKERPPHTPATLLAHLRRA